MEMSLWSGLSYCDKESFLPLKGNCERFGTIDTVRKCVVLPTMYLIIDGDVIEITTCFQYAKLLDRYRIECDEDFVIDYCGYSLSIAGYSGVSCLVSLGSGGLKFRSDCNLNVKLWGGNLSKVGSFVFDRPQDVKRTLFLDNGVVRKLLDCKNLEEFKAKLNSCCQESKSHKVNEGEIKMSSGLLKNLDKNSWINKAGRKFCTIHHGIKRIVLCTVYLTIDGEVIEITGSFQFKEFLRDYEVRCDDDGFVINYSGSSLAIWCLNDVLWWFYDTSFFRLKLGGGYEGAVEDAGSFTFDRPAEVKRTLCLDNRVVKELLGCKNLQEFKAKLNSCCSKESDSNTDIVGSKKQKKIFIIQKDLKRIVLGTVYLTIDGEVIEITGSFQFEKFLCNYEVQCDDDVLINCSGNSLAICRLNDVLWWFYDTSFFRLKLGGYEGVVEDVGSFTFDRPLEVKRTLCLDNRVVKELLGCKNLQEFKAKLKVCCKESDSDTVVGLIKQKEIFIIQKDLKCIVLCTVYLTIDGEVIEITGSFQFEKFLRDREVQCDDDVVINCSGNSLAICRLNDVLSFFYDTFVSRVKLGGYEGVVEDVGSFTFDPPLEVKRTLCLDNSVVKELLGCKNLQEFKVKLKASCKESKSNEVNEGVKQKIKDIKQKIKERKEIKDQSKSKQVAEGEIKEKSKSKQVAEGEIKEKSKKRKVILILILILILICVISYDLFC